MPRRLTLEQFISNARRVHGNKYNYDKAEYINNSTKIIIGCPTHGNFLQSPNAHTMGNGCPECWEMARGKTLKKPQDVFIANSAKVHSNRYDYSLVDYKGSHEKVAIICPLHGIFEQIAKIHLKGCGCPECSYIARGESKRQSQEEFVKIASHIHQNKYDYSLVRYEGRAKKIKIICPEHGIFEQRAGEHLRYGCNKCGYQISGSAIRVTQNEFIERSRLIHNNRYDYSLVELKGTSSYIKIICPEHGIFEQAAGSHLYSKQGCPTCKLSKGQSKIRNFLTSLNIEFEQEKKFENCKNKRSLPFDFYFIFGNEKFLIEYDGQQHFDGWDARESTLKYIKRNDSIKTKFAQDNGFTLIRIPYTEFDNIEAIIKTAIS